MANTRVVVAGAAGRMGRMLIRTIDETPGCKLAGALERSTSGCIGQDAGLVAGIGDLGITVSAAPEAVLTGRRCNDRFHDAGGQSRICRRCGADIHGACGWHNRLLGRTHACLEGVR